MYKNVYISDSLSVFGNIIFYKDFIIELNEITSNSLLFIDKHDYTKIPDEFKKNNILLDNTQLTAYDLFQTRIHDISKLKFITKTTSHKKVIKNISPEILHTTITNFTLGLFDKILSNSEETIQHKYLYSLCVGLLKLLKSSNYNKRYLVPSSSLSINKEHLFEFLNALNYNKISKKEFEKIIESFSNSFFVYRSNEWKIELKTSAMLDLDGTIVHYRNIQKNKKFTKEDFTSLCVEFLYACPYECNENTKIEHTTTLKEISKKLKISISNVNYLTKNMLKMIKYQFITKQQYQELKDSEKSLYTFSEFANQKAMFPDENGEYINNITYYVTPTRPKLTNFIFVNSFGRVGKTSQTTKDKSFIKTLTFNNELNFVNLTNSTNLVKFINMLNTLTHAINNASVIEKTRLLKDIYNEDLQVQFVYKNFDSVKNKIHQFTAILGMLQNLMSIDVNVYSLNMNRKLYIIDRELRFFIKKAFNLNTNVDTKTLVSNKKAFRTIMDRTQALNGSKLHIKKYVRYLRKAKAIQELNKNSISKYTPEYSSKVTSENLSFLLVPSVSNISKVDNFIIDSITGEFLISESEGRDIHESEA